MTRRLRVMVARLSSHHAAIRQKIDLLCKGSLQVCWKKTMKMANYIVYIDVYQQRNNWTSS